MHESRQVERSALGPIVPLTDGDGGQGVVFDLPQYTLEPSLGRLVYKEYLPEVALNGQVLERLVKWRSELDPPIRHRVDAVSAWPIRVVVERGTTRGLVMRRAPDDFVQPVVSPTGRHEVLRQCQYLFVSDAKLARLGIPALSPQHRRELCLDLAKVIALLHNNDLVYGDFSSRNILYRTLPTPGVFVIDCDAVRRVSASAATPPLDSPDWGDPASPVHQTKQSDAYKLALFILRTAAQDLSTRLPAKGLAVLGAPGVELLERALDEHDVSSRPSAFEWVEFFRRPVALPQPSTRTPTTTVGSSSTPQPVVGAGGWVIDPIDNVWRRPRP